VAIRKRGNSWQVDVTLNGNGTVKPSTPRAGCRRPTLNRVSRSTVGRDVARLQGAARDLIHYAEPAPAVREPSARSLDPICRQPSLCDVGMDRLLQDSLHAEPTDAVFIRFHPFSSVFIRFAPRGADGRVSFRRRRPDSDRRHTRKAPVDAGALALVIST